MGIAKRDPVLHKEQRKYEGKFVKARPMTGYEGAPRSVEGDLVVTECRDLSGIVLFAYTYTVDGYSVQPDTIRPTIDKAERLKDPKGGLTAAGRRHFNRTEGSNLKPGVKGRADTPQKMRRKGSFLTRFFTNPSGPMQDDKGKPTRLALSAAAWGEPIPKNRSDAAKLAAKGRRLLERYENTKKK
jgi:hypothetical protein